MSDLILNINFKESKRQSALLIETYEGFIPHNKSRQYSGQLRNLNINNIRKADNLSFSQIMFVKDFLNENKNIQVSKYQYLISKDNFQMLQSIAEMQCLFYKDSTNRMNQVDMVHVLFEKTDQLIDCGDFAYNAKNHEVVLFFDRDNQILLNDFVSKKAILYIELEETPYSGNLVFNYDGLRTPYESKKRQLDGNNKLRDFAFEESIVECLEKAGWELRRSKIFELVGSSLADSVKALLEKDIEIYTHKEELVTSAVIEGFNVGYGIDWFEVDGECEINGKKYDISELVSFASRDGVWTKIDGTIITLPGALARNLKNISVKNKRAVIAKSRIINALELSIDLDGSLDLTKELTNIENIHTNIDDTICTILRDYQKVGVKWLLSLSNNGFGGCLADDMGLGKTLQTIAYLSDARFTDTNNLVVVPKTLLENWRRELKKFAPGLKVYVYHDMKRSIDEIRLSDIALTTYGTVLNDIDKLKELSFENLIIDEAQKVKNPKSNSYRALKQIKVNTRIALTGTPLENNLREYWALMRLLNPEIMKPYSAITKDIPSNELPRRLRNLTMPFLLRRYKSDVLDDLPEKRVQTLVCDLTDEQRNLYDILLLSIRKEIDRDPDAKEIKTNSLVLKGLLYLQELCCHPMLIPVQYNQNEITTSAKLDLLMDRLQELNINGHKAVVFSRFTKMLEIIRKELTENNINSYYLDGNTKNRMEVVDSFENSDNGIFLISLKAGGVGLNIISADTVFIYDPWWNPATEKQAEDRVYRIGQEKDVTVYKLIASNTIEEKIQELQKMKVDIFEEVVDYRDSPVDISMAELKALLS